MSLIFFGLVAFIAGALAAANFVIERMPNAKDILVKIMPYQAIIGFVALVLSALLVFNTFSLREAMFTKLIYFGCALSTVVVGFLLGFPMIQQWITTDEKSKAKAEEIRKKISPYQVLAGLVSMGAGAYLVLAGLF